MKKETIIVGALQVNCYVLPGDAGDAIVIDPGDDAESVCNRLRTLNLRVAIYLLSHGHVDHVSATAAMCAEFPAPVAIHPADMNWVFDSHNKLPPFYDAPDRPGRCDLIPLNDGDERTDAGLTYRILHTPGHTPGSVCFIFDRDAGIFTGDTLFAGSIGRTDLTGGDGRAMQASLKRLIALTDDLAVFPGHGPCSSIGAEKRRNPFMQPMRATV